MSEDQHKKSFLHKHKEMRAEIDKAVIGFWSEGVERLAQVIANSGIDPIIKLLANMALFDSALRTGRNPSNERIDL